MFLSHKYCIFYYFKMKLLDYCSQNIVVKSIGFTCPFVCDHANIDSESTEVSYHLTFKYRFIGISL